MNDTAEVKLAADKLNEALAKLEGALDPMLSDIQSLKKVAAEAEHFEADRASLAQQLDDARAESEDLKAAQESFKTRENDYKRLATNNIQELDEIISQVRNALGQGA